MPFLRVFSIVVVCLFGCGRTALPITAPADGDTAAGRAGSANGDRSHTAAAGSAGTAPANPAATCGNGVIDAGEQCERVGVLRASCRDFGFSGGLLVCDGTCRYDTSACSAAAPRPTACPMPDSPVALSAACVAELCSCDRPALLQCDWDCWSKVACRVATCNNNPARRECADGCANSSADELSLGRCYQASRICTSR
jgi:hypothetical protein